MLSDACFEFCSQMLDMIRPAHAVLLVPGLLEGVERYSRGSLEYAEEIEYLRKQCLAFIKKPTSKRLYRLFQDAETVRRFRDGLRRTHEMHVTKDGIACWPQEKVTAALKVTGEAKPA
jgi:hypothetical protein